MKAFWQNTVECWYKGERKIKILWQNTVEVWLKREKNDESPLRIHSWTLVWNEKNHESPLTKHNWRCYIRGKDERPLKNTIGDIYKWEERWQSALVKERTMIIFNCSTVNWIVTMETKFSRIISKGKFEKKSNFSIKERNEMQNETSCKKKNILSQPFCFVEKKLISLLEYSIVSIFILEVARLLLFSFLLFFSNFRHYVVLLSQDNSSKVNFSKEQKVSQPFYALFCFPLF